MVDVSIRLVVSVVDGRLPVSPKPTQVDLMKWDWDFAEVVLLVLDAQAQEVSLLRTAKVTVPRRFSLLVQNAF